MTIEQVMAELGVGDPTQSVESARQKKANAILDAIADERGFTPETLSVQPPSLLSKWVSAKTGDAVDAGALRRLVKRWAMER